MSEVIFQRVFYLSTSEVHHIYALYTSFISNVESYIQCGKLYPKPGTFAV